MSDTGFTFQKFSGRYHRMPLAEQYRVLQKNPGLPRCFYLAFQSGCPYPCMFCERKDSPETFLSPKDVGDFLSGAGEYDIDTLVIVADEPMMHPEIAEIFQAAANAGFREISIATTGFNMDDKMVAKLISSGLTSVAVPLYSHSKETHDSITGSDGSFETAMHAIRALRDSGLCRVYIHSLPLKQNIVELSLLYNLVVQRMGLPLVLFPVRPKILKDSGGKSRFLKVAPTYSELIEHIKDIPMAGFPLCVQNRIQGNIRRIPSSMLAPCMKLYILMQDYTKAPVCSHCRESRVCCGTFREYLKIYGESELEPFPKSANT